MSSENSSHVSPTQISKLDPCSKDIRILTLIPGQGEDPILCSLTTTSLDDSPRYDALSYVWGDPSICKKIIVDKQERNVTINLFAALRRLRHPTRQKALWIDALCINQDDNDEKTHQVGLMSLIYSRAREVLLWLGDYVGNTSLSTTGELESRNGDNGTAEGRYADDHGLTASHKDVVQGFIFIQLLADHPAGTNTCIRPMPGPGPKESRGRTSNQWLRDYERGLMAIMNYTWWTRVWTVQEVVLAKRATVVCGGIHIAWKTLSKAATNLQANCTSCEARCCLDLDFSVADRFVRKVQSVSDLELSSNPAEIFILHRDRFSSDPRDRVYALLGMLNTSGSAVDVKPDYSLDHRLVYANAVLSLIRDTRWLDILLRPRELGRDPTLPSWVPDWTAAVDTESLSMAMTQSRKMMLDSCMKQPCHVVEYRPETGELTILGEQVDTVISTSEAVDMHIRGRAADDIERLWEKKIFGLESQLYPRGGTYEEAFWRLIAADTIGVGQGAESVLMVPLSQDWFVMKRRGTLYITTMADYRRLDPGEWTLARDTRYRSPSTNESSLVPEHINRRFFMTATGLVGLGSFDTQVGDTVHILAGGKCPFILREADETGMFRFVGGSFVQGIMDGEAAPDWSVAGRVTLV